MIRVLLASFTLLLTLSACADTGSNVQIIGGNNTPEINSFEDCAEAGYIIMKTAPAQCRTPDGRVFVEGRGLAGRDELTQRRVNSFDECVAAGNVIRRTVPATCMMSDGRVFTDRPGVPPTGGGLIRKGGDLTELKPMCRPSCGNGTCEEVVCMAQGCPCPETTSNCPKDCK